MFQYISYYLPLYFVFLTVAIPIIGILWFTLNWFVKKYNPQFKRLKLKSFIVFISIFSIVYLGLNLYLFEVPIVIYKCANNNQIQVFRNPTNLNSLDARYNNLASSLYINNDNITLNTNITDQSRLENQCIYKQTNIQVFDSPESIPCYIKKSGETDELLVKYGLK
jgi:hypothetical protein